MVKNIKFLVILLVGVLLGYFLSRYALPNNKTNKEQDKKQVYLKDVRDGEGKFTNPLLECAQTENTFSELKPFKSSVQDLVSTLEKSLK